MPGETLSNYCERCGRRVDVRAGQPGDVDLGLDRIGSVFRYCSTCQFFVGRACCWNQDVLACTDCGPPGSDESIISPASVTLRKEIAIRRQADLSESVQDLRKVVRVLEDRVAGGVALSASAWRDGWEAAGWIIARADTSRDAAARALWPPPPGRARARFERFHEELAELMKAYLAARALLEERLTAAGEPRRTISAQRATGWLRSWRGMSVPTGWLRSWRGISVPTGWLRSWRGISVPTGWLRSSSGASMRTALLGAVIAVLVVAGGMAVLSGGEPETAILGGQGTPDQTGSTGGGAGVPPASTPAQPSVSEPAAPVLLAHLDFDMLRVGGLLGASEAISDVAGTIEVVPFPSPFDRSVRMRGSGAHRLCVTTAGLDTREVSVAVDMFVRTAPLGGFEFAAVPSDGAATATSLSTDLVSKLLPGRWYHVSARWRPGMPATIEIREAEGAQVLSELPPVSTPAPGVTIEGFCLSASGMASDGELMLDNLRVEQ